MTITASTGPGPATYVSSIAGIRIAWDVCAACRQHVRNCRCDDGPVEPEFLAAERRPDDPPPALVPAPRMPLTA